MTMDTRLSGPRIDGLSETTPRADRRGWIAADQRQFRWMVAIGFFVLLLPALLGRLTGWRWQPWPPGGAKYGSVVGEAKGAAENYIQFAFSGL